MKTTHKIVSWLAVVTLLIVTLEIALSFWSFSQIKETAEARKRAFMLLNHADDLLSALKDAETGERGYLLTGDEAFLGNYSAVRDSFSDRMRDLRQLTASSIADTRVDDSYLNVLGPLVNAKLTHIARNIELRRNNDLPAVLADVRGGKGKRLMDAIRVEMRGFITREETALAEHDAEFQSNMRLLFIIIVTASLFTLLFAFSLSYLIHRGEQQRLKNLIHLETVHLLQIQEKTNIQLQQVNVTLQASEEKLEVTLSSIGDAVMATDAAGRVTLLNPVAERLTGWTQVEAAGRPVEDIFHIINQETRNPAAIPVQETLAHGTIQGLANHTVLISRSGSECPIADSCAPIHDHDERVVGAVLVFRDVTKEYAAQQALRDTTVLLKEKNIELESAKALAEKANHAKSDFLSGMSHELRSPLNTILGFTELMLSDPVPPTPNQKDSMNQTLQAGWHLLKLIDEILDLAKIESGRVPMSQEPVSLGDVLLECRDMIETQAQQHGIRLTFPQFDLPTFVHADRTRVKQVIINLLSNAIKYNRKQGSVEVKCAESTPGRIRVSVTDTGAGLAPEKLAQLFQAFNRLGQETGNEEGTGIGLVVAKQLVELMGGAIGADSTVGVGSVFWFELNSAAEIQLQPEEVDATAVSKPQELREERLHTLLYVEDNPANLKLVEQIIERHPNLRLLSAVDGTRGIEIARASLPDVILMDINLPGISGFEALKILQSDPATAHIPVIALTANAMPRDIKQGQREGFFRYITKPIKIDELMEALDVAMVFGEISSDKKT